jgi:hypothetical protein
MNVKSQSTDSSHAERPGALTFPHQAVSHRRKGHVHAYELRSVEEDPEKEENDEVRLAHATGSESRLVRGKARRCTTRGSVMDERDFEGTLVLEQLAAIERVEDFFDAIDSDDVELAMRLMKRAKIDAPTIAIVLKKIEDSDGEH